LLGQYWRAVGAFEVKIERLSPPQGKQRLRVTWRRNRRWSDWAALSEGCYLLRTNLNETDPAGKFDYTGAPDGTNAKDQLEEMADRPGKLIPVNSGDRDADGTKDYADGFSLTGHPHGTPNSSADFSRLTITVPAPIDLTKAQIAIEHDDSHPVYVTSTNPLRNPLRIWTKDG